MSKNKKLIILVIAVIILLAGAGYLVTSKDSSKTDSQTKNEQQQSISNSTKGSLSSLTASKKAQECTMSYSSASGTGTGTMFTDGNGKGRMHIDIKTEQGNTGQIDQIIKEGKAYSWTTVSDQTYGMILDVSKTSNQTQAQSQNSSSSPNPDQDFDINCKDWKVDESKFAVPTNINFMDINNAQNSMPTSQ